jgi:hypothetical protein
MIADAHASYQEVVYGVLFVCSLWGQRHACVHVSKPCKLQLSICVGVRACVYHMVCRSSNEVRQIASTVCAATRVPVAMWRYLHLFLWSGTNPNVEVLLR